MNVELVGDITRWLTSAPVRRATPPLALVEGVVERLVAAGVPLTRASTSLVTMHPDVEGIELVWHRDRGSRMRSMPHSVLESPDYLGSPIEEVVRTRLPLRCRLGGGPPPFPQLASLAEQGIVDYAAFPIDLADSRIGCFTFATDQSTGFRDDQIAAIEALVPILGLRMDLGIARQSLQSLLNVYLGASAAARVLSGSFRRGEGQLLSSAIWFCDMRGFTAFSDASPAAEVVATLDGYFEIVGGAVEAAGGEILKFIGDAIMAIFPVGEEGPRGPCEKALAAARQALAGLERLNAARAALGQATVNLGIALHLGEVMFGNVGARDRLDFTIIGRSVNEAARLEGLSKELGTPLILSRPFVRAAGLADVASLGMHVLRGVSVPQEVFTLGNLVPRSAER